MLRTQEETLDKLEPLLQAGVVTESRVDQARTAINDSRSRIDSLNSSIHAANAAIRSVEERIRTRRLEVSAIRRTSDSEARRLNAVSIVKSAVEGRVVELKKRVGDAVAEGEALAVIEPNSALLEPVVFVSTSSGKRIERGMAVRIYPSNVRREEYGFMKGTVTGRGDFPVTPETVGNIVNNSQLVREFLADGSQIEIRVALELDQHAVSGYAWSSGGAPPFKIDGGTPVDVSIIVARYHPISKLWPTVKRIVGAP